jgi:glycosyltransferase involved in cell wall biosynthesis
MIKEYAPDNEVIVAINGEHQQPFGEEYRRRILEFVAGHQRVFPVVFPHFRGLSKLWNTIVIHASQDYVLMLNDDIMINDTGFLENICSAIRKNQGRTFLINRSWSHFLVSRQELDDLGYFDERLLGIGEEDGDMTWRYIHRYGNPITNVRMKGFVNYAEETVSSYKPFNIQTHSGTKYSLFNRRFIFSEKYAPDPGGIRGMFGEPVVLRTPGKEQYPNERFYRERKDEL